MKTKYFLISNGDFTCYGSSDRLKDIIDKYYHELNYQKKEYGEYAFIDYSIYRFSYDPKRIEIDYGMDGLIYFIDKSNDLEIDYNDFDKYGIKQKEIKKDFLYHNKK